MGSRCIGRIAAAVLACLLIRAAPTAGAAFVAGIEDLPLMPGLNETNTESVVFATPTGRIIQAIASGEVTRQQVMKFYGETLPELGWCIRGAGVFLREGELLLVEVSEEQGSATTVRFTVEPAAEESCR
jgi:hypothetical protein